MVLINIKNMSKSFGRKHVHDNVNLQVFKGECLGLVGGSGSGKSVLLRSIIGLERPDSGQVIVENMIVNHLPEAAMVDVRKKVAYVFQYGALFDSMTVYNNLAYPLRAHTKMRESEIKKAIEDQLEEFGLVQAMHLYPGELSGGMQKRIGLARSIMLKPDVILYDEPTAGLDPHNTLKIQELILRLKKSGTTSVLVTHDMPTALKVCDRFAFLQNKKIEEEGSAEVLLSNQNSLINQFIRGQII